MPTKKTTVSTSTKAAKGKPIAKPKSVKKAVPATIKKAAKPVKKKAAPVKAAKGKLAAKAKPKKVVKPAKTAKAAKPTKSAKLVRAAQPAAKAVKKALPAKTAKSPKKELAKSVSKKKPSTSVKKVEKKALGKVPAKLPAKASSKPPVKSAVKPAAKAKAKAPQAKTKAAGKSSVSPYQERPGEDYMNAAQREHFRRILLHWKHQLMEEVDRTVHHMQDEAANFPDPNDRATQEEEFSLELRTRDRERKLIKKIDEALQQIENNDYGYCDSCGIEIGIRRLEARPTATLCIDCKTIDEIKERQMGGHLT